MKFLIVMLAMLLSTATYASGSAAHHSGGGHEAEATPAHHSPARASHSDHAVGGSVQHKKPVMTEAVIRKKISKKQREIKALEAKLPSSPMSSSVMPGPRSISYP